jgi:hypothetical protein
MLNDIQKQSSATVFVLNVQKTNILNFIKKNDKSHNHE